MATHFLLVLGMLTALTYADEPLPLHDTAHLIQTMNEGIEGITRELEHCNCEYPHAPHNPLVQKESDPTHVTWGLFWDVSKHMYDVMQNRLTTCGCGDFLSGQVTALGPRPEAPRAEEGVRSDQSALDSKVEEITEWVYGAVDKCCERKRT